MQFYVMNKKIINESQDFMQISKILKNLWNKYSQALECQSHLKRPKDLRQHPKCMKLLEKVRGNQKMDNRPEIKDIYMTIGQDDVLNSDFKKQSIVLKSIAERII